MNCLRALVPKYLINLHINGRVSHHTIDLEKKSPSPDFSYLFPRAGDHRQTAGSRTPPGVTEVLQFLGQGTLCIRGRKKKIKGSEDVWEVCVERNSSGPVVIKRLSIVFCLSGWPVFPCCPSLRLRAGAAGMRLVLAVWNITGKRTQV